MFTRVLPACLVCCLIATHGSTLSAQATTTGAQPATAEPEQVVIERQALQPIAPSHYHVPLRLVPARFITLIAPREGILTHVNHKAGDTALAGAVVFQLDQRPETIIRDRAAAEVAVRQLKIEQAKKKGDADAQALAEAELKVAQLDLNLATLRLEQTEIRADFKGQVYRVFAQPGQFVTAREPIAELGDSQAMRVEIPVDRKTVKEGDFVKVKVEGQEADGKILRISPAPVAFDPLRDIYESLAVAEIEIDNRTGAFQNGQTVYAPLLPRETVTEVPNSSIAAAGESQRKVQVLRQSVVRDVPIAVLAPVGTERTFVTGAFLEGDELIVSTSVELPDGTQVARSAAAASRAADTQGPRNPRTPTTPNRPDGF